MQEPFNSYSKYIKSVFSERVQKISVDAGFTCPNRDGSKAKGGCTYCDNKTFSPFYCSPNKTITQQLNEGIAFFEPKYKTQQYLAYFQSYTNTYASIENLKKLYTEALSHNKVVGMVVSTRPDCINADIINLLNSFTDKFHIVLEIGIESTKNSTLQKINRAHTFEDTKNAFKLTKNTKLHIGGHLILGLPLESIDDMLNHAKEISKLNIHTLKIHQLQIIKGTAMALDFKNNANNYNLFDVDDYISLIIKFLEVLNPNIIVERFASESPKNMIIAPNWNSVKNFEITNKIKNTMIAQQTWQGKYFK
jgi:radical SAM protein (TIGR01212 family)